MAKLEQWQQLNQSNNTKTMMAVTNLLDKPNSQIESIEMNMDYTELDKGGNAIEITFRSNRLGALSPL